MKAKSLAVALLVVAVLTGATLVGRQAQSVGDQMTDAARAFVNSLTPEQKKKALFPYDSKERTNWHFIPMQDRNRKPTRKGLGLGEMNKEQRRLAMKLLAAGTSDDGRRKALSIMTLEAVLHLLESKRGRRGSVRDPDWYFLAIFGTPSYTSKWGWRIEGHHLSINYTVHNGKVASATPAFFGANPAILKKQYVKGALKETLPSAERLALKLFNSLSPEQRKAARQSKHFPEPRQGTAYAKVGPPVGIQGSKLTGEQQKTLIALLKAYCDRMPPAIASHQMGQVRSAGLERIYFAWTGGDRLHQPHTYRVYGPTFVVEFLNTQPSPDGIPANHIHSVWRTLEADFAVE